MRYRLSDIDEILCKNGRTLIEWLKTAKFYANRKVHVVENTEDKLIIRLYTNSTSYQLVAKSKYLGCTASNRRARPGEDWTRGNDLPDGKFSLRTLNKIVFAIVLYEARDIVKYRQRQEVAEDISGEEAQLQP